MSKPEWSTAVHPAQDGQPARVNLRGDGHDYILSIDAACALRDALANVIQEIDPNRGILHDVNTLLRAVFGEPPSDGLLKILADGGVMSAPALARVTDRGTVTTRSLLTSLAQSGFVAVQVQRAYGNGRAAGTYYRITDAGLSRVAGLPT